MNSYIVSIIIPVYNEEKQIGHSLEVIRDRLAQDLHHYNFILIDDGSTDNTWDTLKKLAQRFSNTKIIKLSRNFGKEAALCAGLQNATGDACITMDGDLQHPPELILEMVRLWKQEGYEVIEGVKTSRGKESMMNKAGSVFYYFLLYKLSGYNLSHASDYKLMDAKVLEAWRLMNEHNTFLRGMSAWLGFKRLSLPFSVAERSIGKSKWSFVKLFKLAINSIISFSSIPLHLVTVMGVLFLLGSFVLGAQTLYGKFKGIAADGFTTVIMLQLIIGSTLMISLGIIGTYIARIFEEVKHRPRFVVSEEIHSDNHQSKTTPQ